MKNDLISRSALLETIKEAFEVLSAMELPAEEQRIEITRDAAMTLIAQLEQTEPVRHGIPVNHYKTFCNSDGEPIERIPYGYECPFCGDTGIKHYCPNCGAKMDGGE